MELEQILTNYTYLFILIMARYSGLFLLTPFLGSRLISLRIKIVFVFFLAVITLPMLQNGLNLVVPDCVLLIFLALLKELSIGLILGFIAFLPFAAIQLAGQFIDMRMGFAIVNVIDPLYGVNAPVMGQFKNILATLLFLSMNCHHICLQSIYHSFELIPLGKASLSAEGFAYIFRTIGDLFILAFKISLPVFGTLLIADIIFGFIARTIPQMNIFIMGLPMKIIIGFIILLFSIPFTIYFFRDIFLDIPVKFIELLKLMF